MSTIKLTLADLEALPDDGNRYELIEGELHVAKQPHWHHQRICLRIGAILDAWTQQTGQGVVNLAPGVIFSQDTGVAPDVVWISSQRMSVVDLESGRVTGAPDLVVEVLSPGAENEGRDRRVKLQLYSRHGVREYWVVDWRRRTLEVHRRAEAALALSQTLHPEDDLTSPLLPGFTCRVEDLLGG
jgi:Uma2 family endonuclease